MEYDVFPLIALGVVFLAVIAFVLLGIFLPCSHFFQSSDYCTRCGEYLLIDCPNCDFASRNDCSFCPECGCPMQEVS